MSRPGGCRSRRTKAQCGPSTTRGSGDLGPDDLVHVECLRCDHSELLTAAMLSTAGLLSYTVILDLRRQMRCRGCDARRHVDISIRWGSA